MCEWNKQIQGIIEEIDVCIKNREDEALTLKNLSNKLGYSEFHISRKFKEISGMQFRDYLRYRKLAFALKEVRDTEESFIDIALNYGFSSHEAFTRAFKEAYGMSPSEYRQHPVPVVLRTIIKPFDCYLIGSGKMRTEESAEDVKIYFAIYNEVADSIEVYIGEKLKFVLNCTLLNNNVYFEDSLDIVYLHRLAREEPFNYFSLPYSLTAYKAM